jgi:hypothetical protein
MGAVVASAVAPAAAAGRAVGGGGVFAHALEHDRLLQRDQRRVVEAAELRRETQRQDFGTHGARALTPPPVPFTTKMARIEKNLRSATKNSSG